MFQYIKEITLWLYDTMLFCGNNNFKDFDMVNSFKRYQNWSINFRQCNVNVIFVREWCNLKLNGLIGSFLRVKNRMQRFSQINRYTLLVYGLYELSTDRRHIKVPHYKFRSPNTFVTRNYRFQKLLYFVSYDQMQPWSNFTMWASVQQNKKTIKLRTKCKS